MVAEGKILLAACKDLPRSIEWKIDDYGQQFEISADCDEFAVSIFLTEFNFFNIDVFNYCSGENFNFGFDICEETLAEDMLEMWRKILELLPDIELDKN